MVVTVEQDISRVLSLTHHHFGSVVLWTQLLTGSDPLTIQVQSRQRTPIIANYNTVWVKHRNNFKHEVVSQILGSFIIWDQVLQSPLHHKTCIWFAWMHPWRQNDSSSQSNQFGPRLEIGDDNHLTIIASYGFGQDSFAYFIFGLVGAQSF